MAGVDNHESKPTPDPTTLTTEQMLRAVDGLKDYVDGQLEVLRERFRGIDEATRLRFETLNLPDVIDEKIRHLSELVTVQIQAQNTAGDKSEKTMVETVGKLGELVKTTTDALAKEIGDVKERVQQIDSSRLGAMDARASGREVQASQRQLVTTALAAFAILVTIVLGVVAFVAK